VKILVTGGAGFIGSHVCDSFLALGHDVHALDDLSSGKRENLDPRVVLHTHDIRSSAAATLIVREQFETIAHLAAQIDVRRSVTDPALDSEINVGGTIKLLDAAVRAGTRRFIFSSTGGAIYGEQECYPAPETHPTLPASPYGVSKACAELYMAHYGRQHGLSTIALRYANVYGPRQNPHGEAGVIAIFAQKLCARTTCTIYGDGTQTRDFVYVGDVARANVLALTGSAQGAINIGTGVETDLNRLYDVLARAAGSDQRPILAPARRGEQLRSSIAIDKAAELLGWRPEIALEEGLARTLTFFQNEARSAAAPRANSQ
jgi:UDP-glucose 4-epimerase